MKNIIYLTLVLLTLLSCNDRKLSKEEKKDISSENGTTVTTAIGDLRLAAPYSSESVNNESKMVAWENNKPKAPEGFMVTRYADGLEHPRWTYVAPNNDVFVAEANTKNSANRISLLRDTNQDGAVDERNIFLENLNQNFGMLIIDNFFYVANTDGLYRYPYTTGMNKIEAKGEKIVELSASGYNNHWTRNVITNKDKSKLYLSVGSASNVGEQGMEKEERRANIIETNLDGSGEIIYAYGLRNPVGMDWNPVTEELWTVVNERDKLGDELVPDYLTSLKKGGWYGWPYSYYGQINDPRWKEDPHPKMVAKALMPDVPLGAHTASLGLAFNNSETFPSKYKNGAFIGQHGSWNRSNLSGYKVVFVPFKNGKPQQLEDFLTGFIANGEKSEVYGRPVGVSFAPDGALLVNDDDAGIIWRVSSVQK